MGYSHAKPKSGVLHPLIRSITPYSAQNLCRERLFVLNIKMFLSNNHKRTQRAANIKNKFLKPFYSIYKVQGLDIDKLTIRCIVTL